MAHVKNQHFVPKFILNYFADKERNIWCYDMQWKRIQKKGIGGVAFEEYFYDVTPGEKEGSLEYIYQRAETKTAPIIQKIISHRALNILTLDEKVALAMFIAMQLFRTKTALKNTESIQKQFWEPIIEFGRETGVDLDSVPEPAKSLWHSNMENIPVYTEMLMKKVWSLGSSEGEFYTSDHPVVKGNYKKKDISHIRGVLGLNSDGIEIYFPLTPSLLLCILCERTFSRPQEDVTQYQSQNIEYVNHLQVRQSDKFIFAGSNNFSLVQDMIINNEL